MVNRVILIGHRGVGKSTLAKSLAKEYSEYRCISLDDEVEKNQSTSIGEIFANSGEATFREIERDVFHQLERDTRGQKVIVDVGAGFDGELPGDVFIIWIQRAIDSSQSTFLDRPNLDEGFTLSSQRFIERQKRYRELCHMQLQMQEGPHPIQVGERLLFNILLGDGEQMERLNKWTLTLRPQMSPLSLELLKNLGLQQIEVRDDLIEHKPFSLSDFEILLSRRDPKHLPEIEYHRLDYPLEWGQEKSSDVISLHQRKVTIAETFESLPQTDKILKLALPIHTFSELIEGHRWQQQNPLKRAFLPMSEEGRWNWYRLVTGDKQPIAFFRTGEGSAADQPSLVQILNYNPGWKNFAAILGSPVNHSFTPNFHRPFFNKMKVNIIAIDLKPEEVSDALPFLQELGLVCAAVTSPLKKVLAQTIASPLPVINTLGLQNNQWRGENTDPVGIAEILKSRMDGPTAIWGGGDILSSLPEEIPRYSSRTGDIKQGAATISAPQTLIWGVGADSFAKQGVFPPSSWPLKQVIDLNYAQNSPGRVCALKFGCQYTSGLVMFQTQARAQQEFWNECELK